MKNAFTIIELIFAIVIIGILAAIAIPKLSATRDDAKIATIKTNIMSSTNEVIAYATSKGKIEDDISKMSQILKNMLNDNSTILSANKKSIKFKFGNKNDCIVLLLRKNTTTNNTQLVINKPNTADTKCQMLQNKINTDNYPITIAGKLIVD